MATWPGWFEIIASVHLPAKTLLSSSVYDFSFASTTAGDADHCLQVGRVLRIWTTLEDHPEDDPMLCCFLNHVVEEYGVRDMAAQHEAIMDAISKPQKCLPIWLMNDYHTQTKVTAAVLLFEHRKP